MRPVQLFTSDGDFVVSGQLPAFVTGHEAEVLLWGSRVFRLHRTDGIQDVTVPLRYEEVFATALVIVDDPKPLKSKDLLDGPRKFTGV